MWPIKYVVSTTTTPVLTKLGMEVCYCNGLPRIKSQNPINTCSHEVTWQIKYVISLPPQGLWQLSVARWWLILSGHLSKWWLTTFLLLLLNLKVTWPFTHLVLWFSFFSARFVVLECKRLIRHRLLAYFKVVCIWCIVLLEKKTILLVFYNCYKQFFFTSFHVRSLFANKSLENFCISNSNNEWRNKTPKQQKN